MNIVSEQKLNIDDIVAALREGKTIVYPTETCYGLGCDATNAEAVEKVFAIKQREEGKSMLVVVSDVDMAKRFVSWTPTIQALADKYWPGPLTVVVPVREGSRLAPGVIREGTVAFRLTSHPLVREVCEKLNRPIVSTSANISGLESVYDTQSVIAMFEGKENTPDCIIDGGVLLFTSPSTIVRVVDDHIEVLRQGELVVE